MNIKEVIIFLELEKDEVEEVSKDEYGRPEYPSEYYEIWRNTALDIAVKSLEKQIPKAVLELNDNESYFVCSCGFVVGYFEDFREHKYCLNCGQKLDWELK